MLTGLRSRGGRPANGKANCSDNCGLDERLENAKFKIMGMKCDGCVRGVTAALSALPGVEIISVTVGGAEVRMPPGAMSEMAVLEAVQHAGFSAIRE
jgi:copper chaperone CopZ